MGKNLSGTVCFFGIKSLDFCVRHPYDYTQLHVNHLRVLHSGLKKLTIHARSNSSKYSRYRVFKYQALPPFLLLEL